MRLAAVDIGSNTVHVLVADAVRGQLADVAHYVEMPELGPYVARTGAIGPRGKIAMRALRLVLALAGRHGYDKLVAGATEAVRQAVDGEAFARQASEAIGVPVRIIPARTEAELSFLGVASRHAGRREWVMVDLGGASTEVVIGRGPEMLQCEARLDAGRAADLARKLDLPANRIKAMRAGVEALLLFLDWYGLALLHISHQ